jgi:hypothetical protein
MCYFSIKNSKKIQKINKLKFISFIYYFFKKIDVWNDVISQLQPDLPDSPSITVHLQRRDDRFYSPTRRVPIRNHQISAELKLVELQVYIVPNDDPKKSNTSSGQSQYFFQKKISFLFFYFFFNLFLIFFPIFFLIFLISLNFC